MSMIFVLPMSDDMGPVLSTELLSALDDLQSTRVALSLPKFKFESTYDDILKESLMQTGIVAPFSAGSLCGLLEVDSCALFISEVIQKTIIDVNEKGVEAAAITAIFIGKSAPAELEDPTLVILDHPFQFFIYDETEDLVLFEGRVGAPEVPDAEPEEPLLNATHSDSDFWTNNFGVVTEDPSVFVPTSTSSTTSATNKLDTLNEESSAPTSPPTIPPGPDSARDTSSGNMIPLPRNIFPYGLTSFLAFALMVFW